MSLLAAILRRNAVRLVVYPALLVAAFFAWRWRASVLDFGATGRWHWRQTVADVLDRYGPACRQKFEPLCRARGMSFPPKRLTLLVFKREARLEVWAAGADGPFHHLATYPVLAMSGGPGPKRRSGDLQVPEGFYEIEGLNPNSLFHLSMKVNYPNAEDRAHAAVPAAQLGGDIFIHGGQASVGCVAIGDRAIEELFSLVAQVPVAERRVIISPLDLRAGSMIGAQEPWIRAMYGRLQRALETFH